MEALESVLKGWNRLERCTLISPAPTLEADCAHPVMTRTVTHNIDSVVKQLGIVRSRHIPYAARTTMSRLGFQLSKKDVPQLMRGCFRKPVPFTTGSVFYNRLDDYQVEISINRDKEKNDLVLFEANGSNLLTTRFTLLDRGNIVLEP